jgi:hypothetical protein
MSKSLHIFTPVWGDKFTHLLRHALGRSFQFPLNVESLNSAVWTLLTTPEDNETVLENAHRILPNAEIRIILNPRLSEPNAPVGALKMQALLKVIQTCLDEKSRLLMSTPDFIWGNGSIETMLIASEAPGTCASLAHMRVLPTILTTDLLRRSNADLMDLGLLHSHPSWTACDATLETNGIYHSGIAWRQLPAQNLILVQHQMVSPFLVNFLPSDLEFFSKWKGMTPPAFGEWDHNWPTELINQGRLRYIGSSDAACMLEVTDVTSNMPPLLPRREPGGFEGKFMLHNHHNLIQKQFLYVMRYI